MSNIVIVAHKYLPHPDDDLTSYLKEKKIDNLLHIRHSFPDAPDRKSYYSWFKKGKLFKKKETRDYKFLSEIPIFVKELFFTLKWAVSSKVKWDKYVGMDGLTTLAGLLLKRAGFCKKVIYWTVDFVPKGRFDREWKDKIYHFINKIGYRNADEMWDLSPRMVDARKRYLGIRKNDYKSHRIVPYGIWTRQIKNIVYRDCEKNSLVFMGHLLPNKGVELVIAKIPEIIKEITDFNFKIIGGGSYKGTLIQKARRSGAEKYCQFLGQIPNTKRAQNEIARSCVAIAPYPKDKNSYAYFADSGKIKTYLGSGVPVLLTDVPWNAKEIKERKCGEIISDTGNDLVDKLKFLMEPKVNKLYRKNALEYSKSFDYEKIFNSLNLI